MQTQHAAIANATCCVGQHSTLCLETLAGVLFLSVVDEESLPDVADAISVEGTTGRAIGNVADVVQIVGAAAVVTLGIAADFQYKRLCDVVVLVTVGACKFVADDFGDVLAYFGNGESSYNKATQTEGKTAIADQTNYIDG